MLGRPAWPGADKRDICVSAGRDGQSALRAWYLGLQRRGGKRAPVGLVITTVKTSGEVPH